MNNVNGRRVIICNAVSAISEINTQLDSFSLKGGNLIAMQKAPLFVILAVHNVVCNAQSSILFWSFKEFWDE